MTICYNSKITVLGPMKSKRKEMRFANNAFELPYTQKAASLARMSLKSSCGRASAQATDTDCG